MSFSQEVKNEICKIKADNCCKYAELYGILLFSTKFYNDDVFFKTDREDVAKKCASLIKSVYGFLPDIFFAGGNFGLKANIINTATVYADIVTKEYITDAFYCENCLQAFVRGAFLSAGTVTDPTKSFHCEIKIKTETVAISVNSLLKSKGLNPHLSKRGEYFLVYFKGSESVSDFITFIGSNKSLEIIDAGMIRDMRTRVNRIKNCETANIGKTVDAAIRQKNAVLLLKEKGVLQNLSEELQQAAEVRLLYPEFSLSELSKICGVSKSGLNHRLSKLCEISKSYREGM